MGFWSGFLIGTLLSHGEGKEDRKSTDQLKKEADERDRARAVKRLKLDLSHLPPIVEGTVGEVVSGSSAGLVGDVRIVSFGEWQVCVPPSARIVMGRSIRVVGRRFLHNDVWTPVAPRLTRAQQTLNYLASLTVLILMGLVIWGLLDVIGFVSSAPPVLFSFASSESGKSITLFGMWILIAAMISRLCTQGLPGLWKA